MADSVLDRLAARAFAAWDHGVAHFPDVVVQPSVPILYFGDEPAYRRSPLKVVTVGLNPSRAEFPTVDPLSRFPAAEGAGPGLDYLTSLNRYFVTRPYMSWFSTYTGLLEGLSASFETTAATNRALHTDLGSPVPTDPTWSGLSKAAKAELSKLGHPLWHDLIRELLPDVLLVSVARQMLASIRFERLGIEQCIYTVHRQNPYLFTGQRVRLTPDHVALLVFGPAAQKPFGKVATHDKRSAAVAVASMLG